MPAISFKENGHDLHCKTCGSLLFSVVRDGLYVHVAMGTLVDDPSIRPTEHIFVGSKEPWFTISRSQTNRAQGPNSAANAGVPAGPAPSASHATNSAS